MNLHHEVVEAAEGYLREGHKWLGRPPPLRSAAYLRGTIEQGNRVEELLRRLGYFDPGPRGEVLRLTGDIVETEEEAEGILKELKSKAT